MIKIWDFLYWFLFRIKIVIKISTKWSRFGYWIRFRIKIERKWSRFGIWVLISLYDQDNKKVIKIWDLSIGFFLGSRLQESDQDLRFGYLFPFRIKIVISITRKWSRFENWVLISFWDQDCKKVIKIWDLGIDFFSRSRLQESDQDLGFGYWFYFF